MTPTVAPAQWNDYLARAPRATPFHRYECLEVVADHADARLHPLVAFAGDEPIGLFPVFEKSLGPVTALFSPAPDLKVTYLGPLALDVGDADPTTRERRALTVVDAVLECLDERFAPRYAIARTAPGGGDPRPFRWRGFAVTPRYTYEVDLTRDEDALLSSFSSDARSNIRNGGERCEIEEGDASAIPAIIGQVAERHAEQGETYLVTPEYVTDLYEALPDGVVRPYVARVDGVFAGGMVALEDGDAIYRWQGGAKPDVDCPVNDLLDWRLMREAADRGVERYDLVGANNPRISKYKAKFGPELVTYHTLVRATPSMKVAASLYRRFR